MYFSFERTKTIILMRTVIIPTDFSENAFNALTCAIQYFNNEDARFVIVHTYEKDEVDMKAEFEEKLDHLLERIEFLTYNAHHSFETGVIAGAFINALDDLVDQENADLIVMGTKGKTQNRSLTFGSNTLRMIKRVKCPVLAIPLEMEFKSPDHILYPSQFLTPINDRELELLSVIVYNHVSQLHFLHIAKFDGLSKRQLEHKEFFESRFRESEIIYKRHDLGDYTVIVNNYVTQQQIDLLVLVNSKHSFLESFLQLPMIDSLGLNLKIPFLILQNLPR